ncbi:MAG: aminotransferase class III-fold pyridoxal phosphate-dependent enzyme [bacterium]|nr:aminotransferase class III-fold pyridoxal phosphate-dependent enzyme [bacterium]
MTDLIQTYNKYPIEIVKGFGSYVWDKNGKKYLDFYGGHAVCILGHCHPKIVKAINDQSKKLVFYSNIVTTQPQEKLAKLLSHTFKPEMVKVFFSNSGSEANETALKIARKYTGKKQIISFKGAFHGRSISNLSITGFKKYQQFAPDLQEFTTFAEFGNMQSVKQAYTKDTAAIICEPIQSIGGIKMVSKKFYQDLAKFCKNKNILLIFDEIQTGLGRTGTFWFAEYLEISPDITTSAKGLASGLPIGATIVKEKIATTINPGEHGSTFGGGPIPCATAIATLKSIPNINNKSKYLIKKLQKHPIIKTIHGKGLLLGLELHKENSQFITQCLKNGLIIGASNNPKIYRIMPPLTITKEEIDNFIKKIPNEQ